MSKTVKDNNSVCHLSSWPWLGLFLTLAFLFFHLSSVIYCWPHPSTANSCTLAFRAFPSMCCFPHLPSLLLERWRSFWGNLIWNSRPQEMTWRGEMLKRHIQQFASNRCCFHVGYARTVLHISLLASCRMCKMLSCFYKYELSYASIFLKNILQTLRFVNLK